MTDKPTLAGMELSMIEQLLALHWPAAKTGDMDAAKMIAKLLDLTRKYQGVEYRSECKWD